MWENVCRDRELGGLGIKDLKAFNLALLGKWCWRMRVDKWGMWYRVWKARYRESEGILRVDGRRGSVWLKDVGSLEGGHEGWL